MVQDVCVDLQLGLQDTISSTDLLERVAVLIVFPDDNQHVEEGLTDHGAAAQRRADIKIVRDRDVNDLVKKGV